MATILITGGTGLIGSHLCPRLKEEGYTISLLSREKRSSPPEYKFFQWDPENNEIEEGAIESADYIIHLAGANIGEKRWTKKRKRLIIDSRVSGPNLIYSKVLEKKKELRAFISTSAVGYYGTGSPDKIFSEDDPPGNDFLAKVCYEWEKAADQFNKLGIRTVKLRSGVVLTRHGGVLKEMKTPVKLGIGAPLGDGKQIVPWIHIEDLTALFSKAIAENLTGAYNAVAPDQKTNAEFMSLVSKTLHKPFWSPSVPAFLLKMFLGERASVILDGNKVSIEKIQKESFTFKFPTLEDALQNLLI